MGRKKYLKEEKRKIVTFTIPDELFEKFDELGIKNKSKFFDELLKEYFGENEKGGAR